MLLILRFLDCLPRVVDSRASRANQDPQKVSQCPICFSIVLCIASLCFVEKFVNICISSMWSFGYARRSDGRAKGP